MNGRATVTATEVARRAGVDRSTVSRILNRSFDQHRYASQTVLAVEKAARDLNYRPSTTARALRTGRTMLVGLVVGDIANSFFGQIAGAIETGLRSHGFHLMIGSTSEDAAVQRRHLDEMRHRGVDGIIIVPAGMSGLKRTIASGTPVVLVDRPLPHTNWPYVGIDNHDAGRQLGEHLCGLGYRRVGVVMPDTADDPTLRWRLQGLKIGLGHEGRISWRQPMQLRLGPADREVLAERIVHSGPEVDAVVGLTNDCTVIAMEAIRDLGWRIPDRIGLAGIDDFRAAELLDPPLTVVAQPIDAIASTAVEYLVAAMSGRPINQNCLLPPRLMQRRSLSSRIPAQEIS